jgi:serine phosphatase RsbU (regulator of sigma subunit)
VSGSFEVTSSGLAGFRILSRRTRDQIEREHMLLRLVNAATQHLSTESKLAAFADAAVPAVSDVCGVYLLDSPLPAGRAPDGPIHTRRIAAPTTPGVVGPVPGRRAVWVGGDPATAAVTAAAAVIVNYSPDRPRAWADAAGVTEAIERGRVHCTAMVPVILDDRVHAVIAFGAGPDRPPYGEQHRELFTLISAQAAVALRQGDRYERVRDTALTLQRAMLTAPPPVDGLEIAVRYRPAGARIEVGGDWYDVFPLTDHRPDDPSLAVVVGDVAGHDLAAATVMGQLRSMLRGIALHAEGPDRPAPDRVLRSLDRAITHLRLVPLATCIAMHVRREPGDAAALRVEWSNAGHPAPVLLAPDGATTVLDAPPEPALGVTGTAARTSSRRRIAGGEVLLLFSDGLFERRTTPYDTAFARLRATVAGAAGRSLDDLCDILLGAAPHDDDVVLIALRQTSP